MVLFCFTSWGFVKFKNLYYFVTLLLLVVCVFVFVMCLFFDRKTYSLIIGYWAFYKAWQTHLLELGRISASGLLIQHHQTILPTLMTMYTMYRFIQKRATSNMLWCCQYNAVSTGKPCHCHCVKHVAYLLLAAMKTQMSIRKLHFFYTYYKLKLPIILCIEKGLKQTESLLCMWEEF